MEQKENQTPTITEKHYLAKMHWLAAQLASLDRMQEILITLRGEVTIRAKILDFDQDNFGVTLSAESVGKDRKVEPGMVYIHMLDVDRVFVFKKSPNIQIANSMPRA